MQALQPNSVTGYLESKQVSYSKIASVFSSNKKVALLKAVKEALDNKLYPDIPGICDKLDIDIRTFDLHLKHDPVFASDWEEQRKRFEYYLVHNLHEKAKSNLGTVATLALLKWLENRSWNEKQSLIHLTNHSLEKPGIPNAIDAEIIYDVKQIENNSESK